jgi:ribosomal protein L37E
MTAQLELIEFTNADRCDRCGAQAHHSARREGCSDLLFCSHHIRDHSEKLLDTGWTIISDAEGAQRYNPATVTVNY